MEYDAEVGDVTLRVTESGDGRPVVLFVHGWGCDGRAFTRLLSAAAGVHAVVPDLRGHGRSGVARTPHTVSAMARDLATLLDQRGGEPVVVVGHSLGGNVAAELALARPELVRALVVLDPAYGDPGWADAERRDQDLAARGAVAVAESADAAFAPDADPRLVSLVREMALRTPVSVLRESLRSTYLDPDAFGHLDDSRLRLAALPVPVLALYPDRDRADRARTLPFDQTVATIENCGHFFHEERPGLVWRTVREWASGQGIEWGDGAPDTAWSLPERWNPVLPGFHPDPSIVQVGGTYVLATSTFEWWPGVSLHTSRDLVDWEPAVAVFTDPESLDLADVDDSGGLWAPSISFADGRYWLVVACVRTTGSHKDMDVLLTTSERLSGPWSPPVRLGGGGFDPSLFHEDGRHWLVNMRWDSRPDRFSFAGITLQEIDVTGAVGPEQLVLTSDELLEGPNLYRVDGTYYLMLAEGGTGWNHGIRVGRSARIDGPFELDPEPLLTTRDDPAAPLAKAGHGELVRGPDGGWALVHLASRPQRAAEGPVCVLGRETCLEPVVWADGWPRLAHGGHRPAGALSLDAYDDRTGFADSFCGSRLDPRWVTLRRPPDESWVDLVTHPGALRLRGRRDALARNGQSLVATRLSSVHCAVVTRLRVSPSGPTQAAGIAIWYDRLGNHRLLVRGGDQGPEVVVATRDGADYAEVVPDIEVGQWSEVYLRATLDGLDLRFGVSRDGTTWIPAGGALDLAVTSDDHGDRLRFTGAMVALCAVDTDAGDLWAEFDGVTVTPARGATDGR